ncbi:MAG: chemotaxis protein CheB [Proteobacteria bacterium]|nr:chemotaxis protein CheB [Pseudomonadota bacterium]
MKALSGPGRFDAVVLGGSAGSLKVLLELLPRLPGDFPWPLLAVIHLHPRQEGRFVTLLDQRSLLSVKEAEDKETPAPGHVYFAPADYHLQMEPDQTLSLSAEERVRFSRPSIDVLFDSAAQACRSRLVGVLLSGAGNDGTEGLCRISEQGGLTVIQDPAQAEHPAMPQAALDALTALAALGVGGPDHVLSSGGIMELLVSLAEEACGQAGGRGAAPEGGRS